MTCQSQYGQLTPLQQMLLSKLQKCHAQAISMMHAMVDVYRMDKAVVMEYQASQEGISIYTYHIETGNII